MSEAQKLLEFAQRSPSRGFLLRTTQNCGGKNKVYLGFVGFFVFLQTAGFLGPLQQKL